MSFGLTPGQLVVLSGLLQDQGLRLPVGLTSRINTLKDITTTTGALNYIAWHPLTPLSVKTLLRDPDLAWAAGTIPADYPGPVPEAIRPYDAIGSILNRAQSLLGNGLKGLLDNMSVAGGELQKSFEVQASLDTYKNKQFDDIYLNARNYTDIITHGLTSSFGATATGTPAQKQAAESKRVITPDEIKRSITALSTAVSNLGNLYDWSKLDTVGTAHGFIKNAYKIGVAYNTDINNLMTRYGYTVDSITANDSVGLTQLLQQVTDNDLNTILRIAEASLPDSKLIQSAADFLLAEKVLPTAVAAMLPNKELNKLGTKLASLGVTKNNITSILQALKDINIPNLPNLNQLKQPVPPVDANVIQTQLISGRGPFGNATLDDLFGVLTGNTYFDALDVLARNQINVSNSIDYAQRLQTGSSISSEEWDSFESTLETVIAGNQINTGLLPAKQALSTLIDTLKKEIQNGEIIGLKFTSNLEVTTSNVSIDNFDIRNYRSAIYQVEVQNNDKFDDFDVKVIQNGTTANLVVMNRVLVGTNQPLGTVYANVDVQSNTCVVSYATVEDNNYHHFLRSSVTYKPIHDGSSPDTIAGSSAEINAVYKLDQIARDKQFTGIGTLLSSMASDDVYGEAIVASLVTSRNTQTLETIGITGEKAKPNTRLAETMSQQGSSLSESQIKQIMIASAQTGTDPNLAIANASRYGFFSDYYSKKGNFG